MKKLFSFCFIFLLMSCSSLDKKNTALRAYETVELKNGLQVILVPDNSLPYISLSLLVGMGGIDDPSEKKGLSLFTGSLLNKGTLKRNMLKLSDDLSLIGSGMDVSVGDDSASFTMTGLAHYSGQVVKDFAEVLLEPSYLESEWQRMKKNTLAKHKKTVDSPSSLASLAFLEKLYPQSPYGKRESGYKDTIARISLNDIKAHYKKYYRPNNSLLAVSGTFKRKEILSQLEAALTNWKPQEVQRLQWTWEKPASQSSLLVVDKEDLKQAQVRMGNLAVKRTHPDYLKLRLAGMILGGGFSSRLLEEIRVKRGLTYGIYSYFGFNKHLGHMVITSSTRLDKVGELIGVSRDIAKEMVQKGVTEEELDIARSVLKGNFPRALETAEGLASNLLTLRYLGVSDSYLKNFIQDLESITVAQINEAIKKHMKPEQLQMVVYAPYSKIKDQVNALGVSVEVKNYKTYLK